MLFVPVATKWSRFFFWHQCTAGIIGRVLSAISHSRAWKTRRKNLNWKSVGIASPSVCLSSVMTTSGSVRPAGGESARCKMARLILYKRIREIQEPNRTIYLFVESTWGFCFNCMKERKFNPTIDGRIQCEHCANRQERN